MNNINNDHQMKLNNNLAAVNDVTHNNCKQNSTCINKQIFDAINELNDSNKEILKQQAEQTKSIKYLTSAICCLRGQVRQQERSSNRQHRSIDRLTNNYQQTLTTSRFASRCAPYVKSKPQTRKPFQYVQFQFQMKSVVKKSDN